MFVTLRRLDRIPLLAFVAATLAAAMATASDLSAPPHTVVTRWDPALRLVERSDWYATGTLARWRGRITLTGAPRAGVRSRS